VYQIPTSQEKYRDPSSAYWTREETESPLDKSRNRKDGIPSSINLLRRTIPSRDQTPRHNLKTEEFANFVYVYAISG
jgi:hypothetical protein